MGHGDERPQHRGHIVSADAHLSERARGLTIRSSESEAERPERNAVVQATASSSSSLEGSSEDLAGTPSSSSTKVLGETSGHSRLPASRPETPGSTDTTVHHHSPSWEEKGKSIQSVEEPLSVAPSRRRPPQRPDAYSAGTSVASSPRSLGPSSSSVAGSSANPPGSPAIVAPDLKSLMAALASKTPNAQIRALKKLKLDVELCRGLAGEERGVSLLVALAEPARSWLPTFGCSDVQTTAAAALSNMARVPTARNKISSAGGVRALVQMLNAGSPEAQSNAARALARLAEDPLLSFHVGQTGGCAPLVSMLTSATAFHSAIASVQMTTDHEEAQASATLALASLAKTSANSEKIVKAGGIAPLVLLLSSESAVLKAAAAKCLHSLASDPEVAPKIAQSGAVDMLLAILESPDAPAQAAAALAIGATIFSERVAASAIPLLVKLLESDLGEARTAAAQSLASLTHNSTINRVKAAGEPACIPLLVQQMQSVEMQLKLAGRLDALSGRVGEAPLLTLLEGVLGKQGVRGLSRLAQQVEVPLNNSTDISQLAAALKKAAAEEQHAIARLCHALLSEGFSQSKFLEHGLDFLIPFARMLRSESETARAKTAAGLANLASINPEAVRHCGCEEALVLAAKGSTEARLPALRCLLNLTEDEDCLDGLVTAGCIPVLLSAITNNSVEVQRLGASTLANVSISPKLREMVSRGGGVPSLVALLAGSNAKVQAAAAAALWQLCGDRAAIGGIGATDAPRVAVHALSVKNAAVQENVTGLVASLAQSRQIAASLAYEGAVDRLAPLLRSRSTEVQAYAADALRCIAGVGDGNCAAIADSCLPTLTLLLGSPLADAQLSAAGCLAALARSTEVKDSIREAGAIFPLVQLLRTGQPQGKVAAATALTNLSINNSANLREFVNSGGVAPLKLLLRSKSPAARKAAEGALSSLAGAGSLTPLKVQSKPSDVPPTGKEVAEDPGTPSATLLKRKSWRSPSMEGPLPQTATPDLPVE